MKLLLLLSLLGSSVLSLWVLQQEYQGRSQLEAITRIRSARFGEHVSSRIELYLKSLDPQLKLVWSAEPQGLLGPPVRVSGKGPGHHYYFLVQADDSIEGLDQNSQALIQATREWSEPP